MPAPRQKVRWTREATRDVRETWRYYARVASADVANKLILKLIEGGTRIEERPFAWRARDDVAPGLRAIRVPPYSLYYRVLATGAEVLRVLHERRDAGAVFREPSDGD